VYLHDGWTLRLVSRTGLFHFLLFLYDKRTLNISISIQLDGDGLPALWLVDKGVTMTNALKDTNVEKLEGSGRKWAQSPIASLSGSILDRSHS
jgi:hypothetical protein